MVCERRYALMRAKRSFDQHRRTVDGLQGCAICLLGIVRRAYQHATGVDYPTKASAEGGRDEVSPYVPVTTNWRVLIASSALVIVAFIAIALFVKV